MTRLVKLENGSSMGDNKENEVPPGCGHVFVEFASVPESCNARKALNGRKFSGKPARVEWMAEEKFALRDLSEPQPNYDPMQSSTNRPELAAHVPALVKQIEEMERLGREAARQAATVSHIIVLVISFSIIVSCYTNLMASLI